MPDIGSCENCNQRFSYALIHNGFNDSAYAYCDTCGCVASSLLGREPPTASRFASTARLPRTSSGTLIDVAAGVSFELKHRRDARIADTHSRLMSPPDILRRMRQGPRKDGAGNVNWQGLYCIIVEGRSIKAPWKT